MADPILALTARLQAAFDALVPGADPVVRPSDRADFQANGALAVAKQLGRSPRDVAAEVVATAELSAAGSLSAIAEVEIAGPGFLNLTLLDEFVAAEVAAVAADPRLGVRAAEHPERVVVDYSAPNVAKEMHVGHLRTTIIGDALVRLLTFLGHDVLRENHVGDWGTPFGMLIEHLLDLGEDAAAHELSVGDLDDFYRQARAAFDDSPEMQERARERVVLLQAGDPETLRLWEVLVRESERYFATVYDKLGVLLRPDDIVGESFYNLMLPEVVEELTERGLAVESEGATVVFLDGYTNREGEAQPLIVQNSQGGFNYATTDLATVRDRVGRRSATWLLYVVGAPQAQHFAMCWEVCRLAGWLVPPARAVHVMFGNVLGPDRKMFKTRSGATVKLVALLDEAVERAEATVAEKNPDLPADERAAVARAVGIGAVKYADLSTDRIKDYVFDWDRMLSFDGNTAPYLQYAHARIRSILRRGEVDPASLAGVVPSVAEPAERALALTLLGFDAAVQETVDRLSPHRLCTYLFELASAFTTFYEACPVLKAPDEATRVSRLALADLTARVLREGLGLLGIEAPDRM
jgi:arginyl-tRNA synthetase